MPTGNKQLQERVRAICMLQADSSTGNKKVQAAQSGHVAAGRSQKSLVAVADIKQVSTDILKVWVRVTVHYTTDWGAFAVRGCNATTHCP